MSDANQIAVGAARVKLDPPVGIAMMGYGGRTGRSSGIHDELCAQAIVIGDGIRKLAIASVDVLALGVRVCDAIAAEVAARSDLAADSIMICATHTHSAPMFNIFATPRADSAHRADRSIEWERALPGKIAEAILEANRRLEPVRIKPAAARFTLGTNRRLRRTNGTVQLAANYGGPADPDAVALGFSGAMETRSRSSPTIRVMGSCSPKTTCSIRAIGRGSRPTRSSAGLRTARARRRSRSSSRARPEISIRGAAGALKSPLMKDPRWRTD